MDGINATEDYYRADIGHKTIISHELKNSAFGSNSITALSSTFQTGLNLVSEKATFADSDKNTVPDSPVLW